MHESVQNPCMQDTEGKAINTVKDSAAGLDGAKGKLPTGQHAKGEPIGTPRVYIQTLEGKS